MLHGLKQLNLGPLIGVLICRLSVFLAGKFLRSVFEIYSDPRRALLSSFFLWFSLVNQPLYSLAYMFNKLPVPS